MTQTYQAAVITQRRAQAEFETSEPTHRAKSKAALAKATLQVVTAATGLVTALERGVPPPPAPPARTQPRKPFTSPRPTTRDEEDLLRRLLMKDLLPRPEPRVDPRQR